MVGRFSVDGVWAGLDATKVFREAEKGFEEGNESGVSAVEVENGFEFPYVRRVGFELNRVLPRFWGGSFGAASGRGAVLLLLSLSFPGSSFDVLIALIALMLPSFLRQGFDLQANM